MIYSEVRAIVIALKSYNFDCYFIQAFLFSLRLTHSHWLFLYPINENKIRLF